MKAAADIVFPPAGTSGEGTGEFGMLPLDEPPGDKLDGASRGPLVSKDDRDCSGAGYRTGSCDPSLAYIPPCWCCAVWKRGGGIPGDELADLKLWNRGGTVVNSAVDCCC